MAGVWQIEKASMLGHALLALRRTQNELVDSLDSCADPGEKSSVANAICRVVEQRRVLLRIPGPPTGADLSRDQVLKLVRAEPIETEPSAVESTAPTPDPMPEIKNPAENGGAR